MTGSTKVITVAVLGGSAVFLAVFGVGAYIMATHDVPLSGDLSAALVDEYEPTSEWIEEGLDPDVTTFGFGGPAVDPSGPELSEGQIQQLVNARQADLMGCYASALEEDQDLKGRVDFQFGIAPDGHVAMVRVTGSTLASTPTEDCMVEQARTWSFPATNRSVLMKFDTDFTFTYE